MPTIEYMMMHRDIARADLPDEHYIANPLRSDIIDEIGLFEYWIQGHGHCFRGILPYTSRRGTERLGALEKKQLADLRIALSVFAPTSERYDDGYLGDLETWSAGLLRRYIRASGNINPSESAMLENPSLSDLRIIVEATLSVLASEERLEFLRVAPAMCTFGPEDFDDDLYEPFAWLYGALLAAGCRALFNPTSINLEADWRPYLALCSMPY